MIGSARNEQGDDEVHHGWTTAPERRCTVGN
jgi:hypothetical protein